MTKAISEPIGIAIVDKPAGMTSHDVVSKARKSFGTKKVGHSGTLDPDATGVLILGVGRATRLLQFLTLLPKSYKGEIVFGEHTSTLDSSGEIIATYNMNDLTLPDVREATKHFLGEIEQIPPMVSAVRIKGKRLYEIAREGDEIDRPSRSVRVDRFEVNPTVDPKVYEAFVDCSSGTYIRSLAADLGSVLGGGAHLRNLRRIGVGSFKEDEASQLEEIVLQKPIEGMRDFEQVKVDDDTRKEVSHGRVFDLDRLETKKEGPWALIDYSGELLAVYKKAGDSIKPVVVIVDP